MSDPIAPFLAQFPGPIQLRSPLWWRRAVLWSIIWFFGGLVVMIHTFPVGLIVVIVGPIGPWWYHSGALLLDDTGFIYKWPFWQSRRLLWIDVDHFELTSEENEEDRVFGNVVFDYAPREGTWRGKWTTAMCGRNLGLGDTVINTGLTPETKGKFNKEVFACMKRDAIFINAARGAIHNEDDLTEALQKRLIWGAGLDVTNPEPMRPDHPLLSMPNVSVLPHIGSATEETRAAMSLIAAKNTVAGLRGERIPFVVNPEVYS